MSNESAIIEAGLWEENGVREVHGMGERFRTVEELRKQGYRFALRFGSNALQKAFAWLRGDHSDACADCDSPLDQKCAANCPSNH